MNKKHSKYYLARMRSVKKSGKGRYTSREFCAELLGISKNKLADIENGTFPEADIVALMVELYEDIKLSNDHCHSCPVYKARRKLNASKSSEVVVES
jgi:hypothetical protein